MLTEGERAPELGIPDAHGETVTLAGLRGKKVVVYFYPRDDTPGCTVEACGFRDHDAAIAAAGAVVLGISPDDAKSHAKFARKHGLPFRLLCDPDHRVAEAWGAWGEKSMYGKKYMGVLRSTFLVDEQGRIARAWPKVKVDGHAAEVLAAVRGEAGPPPAKPKARKPAAKKKPAAQKKTRKR